MIQRVVLAWDLLWQQLTATVAQQQNPWYSNYIYINGNLLLLLKVFESRPPPPPMILWLEHYRDHKNKAIYTVLNTYCCAVQDSMPMTDYWFNILSILTTFMSHLCSIHIFNKFMKRNIYNPSHISIVRSAIWLCGPPTYIHTYSSVNYAHVIEFIGLVDIVVNVLSISIDGSITTYLILIKTRDRQLIINILFMNIFTN